MTHLVSRPSTVVPLILIPLFVSLACLTFTGGTTLESPGSDESPDSDEVSVQGKIVFGPGSFNFPDPAAGLADLESYKATLSLSFDGTEAGQPSQWSRTYTVLATKEPAARQLTIESAGDLTDLDPVYMAERSGATYEWRSENTCTANAIEEGNSLGWPLEPARFMTGARGADEAGSETINGATTIHYTFDERALGLSGIAKSTGEMWIASEGGYIVKYLVKTEGNADYFGEGVEGTVTRDYELTEINQPVAIELPEDCPAGMINAPRLPDATDLINVPGLVSYTTASTSADAAAFYEKELAALGWKATGTPSLSDFLSVQDFTQADQQIEVTVFIDEGGKTATVQLVLGHIQP